MNNLNFLSYLIPLGAIGVLVLFVVAIVQQGKQEHPAGFKQAFFTVVSMVMLMITVGSLVALLQLGGKQLWVKDNVTAFGFNPPPTFALMGNVSSPTNPVLPPSSAYTCKSSCEFTADDKTAFTNWKQQYHDWQDQNNRNLQLRRNLVGPLAFLIISLPLYFIFMRLMERGAKNEPGKRPSSLRSLYYYFLAFGGLIITVISAGSLVNTGLQSWLKIGSTTIQTPVSITSSVETNGLTSVITCAAACGFTADDVALAQSAQADIKAYGQKTSRPINSKANDVATELPLFLIGLPLFWYHFARIRKETQEQKAQTSQVTS
ncbi:MAG: hypothetical protein HY092_02045 [Candidatus Kerfeldbacteria bacterium]|nr:hypothetical protein [Candidatus Kerfeldbacteria bacterium]